MHAHDVSSIARAYNVARKYSLNVNKGLSTLTPRATKFKAGVVVNSNVRKYTCAREQCKDPSVLKEMILAGESDHTEID